jgi:hypothetical protein
MKVGFIVECGPEGAETKVIPYLARMIDDSIEPDVIPLARKPVLKRECGGWVKALLERGCSCVLIIWDLLPDWGEYEGKGCRHDDREDIAKSLNDAGLDPADNRVRLICVEKMLEAWLIADERALSAFLSTQAHPVHVPRQKRAERISDPKAALSALFEESRCRIRRYVDRQHAIQIAEQMPDFARLRRLQSFRRFEAKLTC